MCLSQPGDMNWISCSLPGNICMRFRSKWQRVFMWIFCLLVSTLFVRQVLFMRYYGDLLRGGVFLGSWANYEPESLRKPFTLLEAREFADKLMSIYRDLTPILNCNNTAIATQKSILALHHLASELDPRLNAVKGSEGVADVFGEPLLCSERYDGSLKGWAKFNCPKLDRIGELITTILVKPTRLQIEDIRKAYPTMEIVAVVDDPTCLKEMNLKVVTMKGSYGEAWNEAMAMVSTLYVFVGRDLRSFPSPEHAADLERAVRLMENLPDVSVVGGATRNSTRHWNMPCFQAEVKNYGLRIRHGYHYSSHECMYCDYVEGPFVARTRTLIEVGGLDGKLKGPKTGFLDLFLRLQDRALSLACPDLLFEVQENNHLTLISNEDWIPLARKWLLDQVILPGGLKQMKFDCSVTDVNCQASYRRTDMFLMPPCCRDKLNRIVVLVDKFCKMWNISYVLDSGSVLGAVKMAGVIPWDIDGDVMYTKKDHELFKTEGVKFFSKYNLTLAWFHGSSTSRSTYFQIIQDRFFVEMWGLESIDPGDVHRVYPYSVVPFGREGGWVVAPPNPGKYSRNRYGVDVLKHAHSWRQTGGSSSWEPYESGKFHNCLNFKHHACLDKYPPDGNIPFDLSN